MKNTELKRARDAALYAVYKRCLSEGRFARMRDVASAVCKSPAPRFYIEGEKASLLVGRILANESLISLNACSRRLARELYRRYKQYLEEHPGCKLSRERILEEIVEQPAPEFFIEPQRTRKILYIELKKARGQWGKY